MKQKKINLVEILRTCFLLSLFVFFCFASSRAQVIPRVCVSAINNQDGFVTLSANITAGLTQLIAVSGFVPVNSIITINPGGGNQQSGYLVTFISGNTAPYTLVLSGNAPFLAHQAGETVKFELREFETSWGYQNISSATVTIPIGATGGGNGNYFAPAPNFSQPGQPETFLPGINENVFSLKFASQLFPVVGWIINRQQTSAVYNNPVYCGIINFQGRLSDAGNSANGQYDLRFQAFNLQSGGIAESSLVIKENVPVTNGIFTVQLNFGGALRNNYEFKFLEIAVRSGAATGNDPFTTLLPRQTLSAVPFAINAQTALIAETAGNSSNSFNAANLGNIAASQYVLTTDPRLSATNNANFIQNTTTPQTANFNISGNGTIGGNLTVNGSINLGQNVTTAFGSAIEINPAMTNYTLVPGLTQTINVPANSSLLISTDGGLQSKNAAINSYSVVDVAIFADGAAVGQRRIVIVNNPLPASVGNWALNIGQTLAAGNHTIEVRVRNGLPAASPAVTSGDALLRGQLTVAVIKK